MKMPKPLPTIDLNNVNEIIFEELELTNGGVAMAPRFEVASRLLCSKRRLKPPQKSKNV
jgi:hypothetical protein